MFNTECDADIEGTDSVGSIHDGDLCILLHQFEWISSVLWIAKGGYGPFPVPSLSTVVLACELTCVWRLISL